MTSEQMAAAHPYAPALGGGLEWTPTTVTRWEQGRRVATVRHDSGSAWAFWHDLHFAQVFPTVTHWWFRSLWTGRVQVSAPDAALSHGEEVWGWMTFDVLDQPRRAWMVAPQGTGVSVSVPYPPNAIQPANLALRLALGRLIVATLHADLPTATWLGVTSLVPTTALAATFPTSVAAAHRLHGGAWRLASASHTTLRGPLRADMCRLLDLVAPGEA